MQPNNQFIQVTNKVDNIVYMLCRLNPPSHDTIARNALGALTRMYIMNESLKVSCFTWVEERTRNQTSQPA
jgi:hypothetical protein